MRPLADTPSLYPADEVALIHREERWTWGDLDRRSAAWAARLVAQGVQSDDLVAFAFPNGVRGSRSNYTYQAIGAQVLRTIDRQSDNQVVFYLFIFSNAGYVRRQALTLDTGTLIRALGDSGGIRARGNL